MNLEQKFVLGLFVLLLVLAAWAVVSRLWASGLPTSAQVVRVADGDTLTVRVGTEDARVRLLGIDAPELAHDGLPDACGAVAAAERLAALLPAGTPVTVVSDSVGDKVDRYGRRLAYVEVAGSDVGGVLVAEGLVEAWHPAGEDTPTREPGYWLAEQRARLTGTGSWPACGQFGR